MLPIESAAQLRQVLEVELGYCTCAFADAIPLLRNVLRLAKARSDSLRDKEAFQQASDALFQLLQIGTASGLASWFVYGLDRADLISHNYNVTDVWITDKGLSILDAMERFPDPSLIECDEPVADDAP